MNTTSALDRATLYLDGGGRLFCGAERCAGHTAHVTGCDLYGQPVLRLTDAGLQEYQRLRGKPAACETCGFSVAPS